MATIETIGSSGCDYTSLQAWADAHNADLTSDPDAPYIAQLEPEEFSAGVNLAAEGSLVTDSTHYLGITAKPGYEFKGDFYADFPIVKGEILCVPYTRISHIVIGKGAINEAVYLSCGVVIDSVGMWQVDYSNSNDKYPVTVTFARAYLSANATLPAHDDAVVRNCIMYDISVCNTDTGSAGAMVRGVVHLSVSDSFRVLAYNNVFDKASLSTDGDGPLIYQGISFEASSGDSYGEIIAKNNIVGSQTNADTIQCLHGDMTEDFNAVCDNSGAGSHDINNIVSADVFASIIEGAEDFHVLRDSPLTSGIGPGADSNVPTVDIAGNERSGTTCPMGAYAVTTSAPIIIEVPGLISEVLRIAPTLGLSLSESVPLITSQVFCYQPSIAQFIGVYPGTALMYVVGIDPETKLDTKMVIGDTLVATVMGYASETSLSTHVDMATGYVNVFGLPNTFVFTTTIGVTRALARVSGEEPEISLSARIQAIMAEAIVSGYVPSYQLGAGVFVPLSDARVQKFLTDIALSMSISVPELLSLLEGITPYPGGLGVDVNIDALGEVGIDAFEPQTLFSGYFSLMQIVDKNAFQKSAEERMSGFQIIDNWRKRWPQ